MNENEQPSAAPDKPVETTDGDPITPGTGRAVNDRLLEQLRDEAKAKESLVQKLSAAGIKVISIQCVGETGYRTWNLTVKE